MSSTAPTEFLPFPKLPPELREMVWDEALPTLDLQRFNAEIAPHPDFPNSEDPEDLVLCLTPNDEFVQLTSGYVGLLGACRESRWAALAKIKCHLPINYIARDADGSVAVRFAKVPFNPDGRLCISGLGPALRDANIRRGARGIDLPGWNLPHELAAGSRCAAFTEIKNLAIVLDLSSDLEAFYRFMLGCGESIWPRRVSSIITTRMTKLDTVALVDESWMNERHHIDPKDFEWLHKPARVVRPRGDDDGWDHVLGEPTIEIPWKQLLDDFESNLSRFKAFKESRAGPVDDRAP